MPTFDTPGPITVALELLVGDARITASERADTVVEVRPSDESSEADVKAAGQTRVEYAEGRLLVKTPKSWRRFGPSGNDGSVDVTIELPAGSHIRGDAALAALRCEGRLGECRITNAAGDIHLGHAGTLHASTATGAIIVDRVTGGTEVSTGSGAVRIREIDGIAAVKNSNGDTWVGEVAGDLRVNAANGNISVDRANAGVNASTANGSIRIGEVVRGTVAAKTAYGEVEIGIREGTAAWLDLHTSFGTVRNDLDAADSPGQGDDTVNVRARTSFGDIIIRRS
ncbi:MAG TPA: DUF4097 family beta strand repeat-containing protein [Streptosporangiaceae bacterium]|nr:DUF4097 family beta strand repeat-containing protein [Streptosporangiaceae bacterium]